MNVTAWLLASGAPTGKAYPILPEAFKDALNRWSSPTIFVVAFSVIILGALAGYRTWTKPKIAVPLLLLGVAYFVVSILDDLNFRAIVAKPDNVPIVMLLFIVGFFLWLSLRQAAINDERLDKGLPPMEADEKVGRVLVWPDLVYEEFICTILIGALVVIWAFLLPAPLEEPADPAKAPNPAKAPWYFLGLQEMLVYFDPWIAGVVLPTMIITGLMATPYMDPNPKGNGYYTLKERPFAIGMFLYGFIVLWVALVIMGTFLRGPNWNFFGPYEFWDVHKLEALVNVNLSEYVWVRWFHTALPENALVREAPGFLLLAGYFLVLPPLLAFTLFRGLFKQMGFIRYNVMIIHFLVMGGMVLKMVGRWTINLKYVVAIPEWFFNI